jgi:hypothetical protein
MRNGLVLSQMPSRRLGLKPTEFGKGIVVALEMVLDVTHGLTVANEQKAHRVS